MRLGRRKQDLASTETPRPRRVKRSRRRLTFPEVMAVIFQSTVMLVLFAAVLALTGGVFVLFRFVCPEQMKLGLLAAGMTFGGGIFEMHLLKKWEMFPF